MDLLQSSAMAVLIVFINLVLRGVQAVLVHLIGHEKHSDLVMKLAWNLFLTQFMNTGFLLMLSQANFSNAPLPFSLLQYVGLKN